MHLIPSIQLSQEKKVRGVLDYSNQDTCGKGEFVALVCICQMFMVMPLSTPLNEPKDLRC
jgi:hypothetical protein